MTRLTMAATPLAGVLVVQRQRLRDPRGFLARAFDADELRSAGWVRPVAQVNQSVTDRRGTVRGIHFQYPPSAEMKLVSCLRGDVWDVIVDVRRGSPTFLNWHATRLSGDDGTGVLIPEGCAHGFQALSDDVELLYCHSAAYDPAAEAGLNPRDPRLAIGWPLGITELSERDAAQPFVDASFEGVRV